MKKLILAFFAALMLLGCYTTVLTAVYEMNIPILIPLAIGILIGVVGCAKVLEWLFSRYPQAMYFGVLGFVFGSIPALIPQNLFASTADWWLLLTLPLGTFISWFFSSDRFNKRFGGAR